MPHTATFTPSKEYEILLTGDHTVVHGCFESIPVVMPVDVFFFDTPSVDSKWSSAEYLEWTRRIFSYLEMHRQHNCTLVLVSTDRKGASWSKSALTVSVAFEFGWALHRELVWQHGHSDFHRAHLPFRICYVLKKGNRQSRPFYKDVIRVAKDSASEGHLSALPVAFVQFLLKHYVAKTDIVMDPFAGSGSVMRACRSLNIQSISVEADGELANEIKKKVTECLLY